MRFVHMITHEEINPIYTTHCNAIFRLHFKEDYELSLSKFFARWKKSSGFSYHEIYYV